MASSRLNWDRTGWRVALIALLSVTLASCGMIGGTRDAVTSGERGGPVTGSADMRGFVIADEPRAALEARRILERGGSAGDAAAALALGLSVTYPAAASLGGGGICLYYDRARGEAVSIDFLPRVPERDGPVAVPGLLRGLELIHSEWGRLSWDQVVEPARSLADDGFGMSKALAWRAGRSLAQAGGSAEMTALLGGRSGPPREDTPIAQPGLAKTLSLIARNGPADFYTGETARRYRAGVQAVGGTLSAADQQAYRTGVAAPGVIEGRRRTAFLAAERTGSGVLMGDIWRGIDTIPVSLRANPPALAGEIERLTIGVLASYGVADNSRLDFGSTGFVVVGPEGDAAVCGLTLNGAFGTGRVGAADGVVMARAPRPGYDGLAGAFLSPVVGIDNATRHLVVAGIGAGGSRAPAAATFSTLSVMAGGEALKDLLEVSGAGPLDTVHVAACQKGLPAWPDSCAAQADPYGAGLATRAR